jgi:hypothetical protein
LHYSCYGKIELSKFNSNKENYIDITQSYFNDTHQPINELDRGVIYDVDKDIFIRLEMKVITKVVKL